MINETILHLEKQAMERWRNGDPFGFVELSAQEVAYVDPGLTAPIVGLEKYSAFMKQIEGKVHYQCSEFIEPKVTQVGNAALLSYNYRSTVLNDSDEVVTQTPWNVTVVYFLKENRWQIVHGHFSFQRNQFPTHIEIPLPVQLTRQESNGLLGELMGHERQAMERWRKGDPDGFLNLSAEDVTYFDPGTPARINGRDALRIEYAPRRGQVAFDVMDFIAPQVQVCGNMAVLFYRFLTTNLEADGSIAQRIPWNCTEVYEHRSNQWKILHTHWSYILGKKA